jgi:hypothetical protein
MKVVFTLLAFLLLPVALHAQQGTFHRGYYYDTAGVASFYNNGALAEAGNGDFLYSFPAGVMRTSPTGVPIWASRHTFTGGTATQRVVTSQILPLPGGDFMIFGKLPNIASSLRDTFLVARLTSSGAPVWARMLPMTFPNTVQHRKAILCTNGDILIGFAQSGQQPNYTVATRMTSAGTVVWQHLYLNYSNPSIARQFYIWDVTECSNGDFILGGFGSAPTDNIVARINSSGTLLWSKKLNDYSGPASGRPWRLRELPGGNIRVVIDGPLPGWGMGYVELDGSGNIAGSGKAYKAHGFGSASIQPNGDMLFMQSLGGFMYVSAGGSVVFARTYDGAVTVFGLATAIPTADGGFAAAGGYAVNGGGPFSATNGYMVKTTSSGSAPPYDTANAVADTPYTNTSTAIALLDSVVNMPLQSVAINQVPITPRDTLFAFTQDVRTVSIAKEIGLYPNPARQVVHFGVVDAVDAAIYTADGRAVLAAKGVKSINISSLSPGVYLVRLTDKSGKAIGVGRLVLEE